MEENLAFPLSFLSTTKMENWKEVFLYIDFFEFFRCCLTLASYVGEAEAENQKGGKIE